MASAGLGKELECSVCLTLYTDPVTLRCGHNFCRDCIDQVMDTQDESGVYSCPECRAEFQERPTLMSNITLCNVVENFRSTHGAALVYYTYCVNSFVPSLRSYLQYQTCPSDKNLKDQSEGPEHVLTDPSASLEMRKCPAHNLTLEYYCTEDSASICMYCNLTGDHRGHRVEKLDEASQRKKQKLSNVHLKLINKRQRTEESIWNLERLRRKAQEKASGGAERVTALFKEIRRRVDDLEKRLLIEISRQENQVSQSLSNMIKELEIKKEDLSRKMRHIEELCIMRDPLTVLQDPDTGDLCDPEEDGGDEGTGGHDGGDEGTGGHDGGDEGTGGHDVDEDTEGHDGGAGAQGRDDWVVDLISDLSQKLSDIIRGVNVTFYVQDSADIILDENTAHDDIFISEDLKTATWTINLENSPEREERFRNYYQVMSERGFDSGRHYWDVMIRGSRWWSVGMCYPSIARRGHQSYIGDNDKSWGLSGGIMCYDKYSVIHDSDEVRLRHQSSSDRVRIYLDYEAGQLSFYELCDPIRHLHTYSASFSEPLYAVLWINDGSMTISGGIEYWTPS